mgnify:FL=1
MSPTSYKKEAGSSFLAKWSGKRGSNSRPQPWQGCALPLSYFRINGASAQNRTVDTGIFSPLLYQLSYRGKMATRTRLELVTSAVTGRHSNQLNHRAVLSSIISIGYFRVAVKTFYQYATGFDHRMVSVYYTWRHVSGNRLNSHLVPYPMRTLHSIDAP